MQTTCQCRDFIKANSIGYEHFTVCMVTALVIAFSLSCTFSGKSFMFVDFLSKGALLYSTGPNQCSCAE